MIGDWHLWQRRGGHRTSTDDVLTAWLAAHRSATQPRAYLDLGCGIGSVLLMTTHALMPRFSCGIEAQTQSVQMARRAVDGLPAPRPPIEIVHEDFRTYTDRPEGGYDLITGSPPYFPLGTGSLPNDPQRRACRFEARGGIEDYCDAADRLLAPDGRFVFVFQSGSDARVREAIAAAGLHPHARAYVRMREDRPSPFLTVYDVARSPSPAGVAEYRLAIRDASGHLAPTYRSARAQLGVHCIEDDAILTRA